MTQFGRWQATDPWTGWRLHATAAFNQRSYRFRNDDGTEATATWKAAQSTPISQPRGEVFRLRIEIQETGGGSANNQTIVLQSNINGAGWFDVGPTSNGVRLGNSQHVSNGTPTTNQLTAGTGTFIPGVLLTSTSGTNISFAGNDHTEVEWSSLLITADVPLNATVQFRVTVNGSVTSTVTASPSLTATNPPAPTTAPTLSLGSVTTTSIATSWTSGQVVDTYELQRKLTFADDSTYATIQNTSALDRNDTGLASDTDYSYRVRFVNAGGSGPWSNVVSALTLSPPPAAPVLVAPAPQDELSRIGDITFEWVPPEGQTHVALRRSKV